MLEEYQKALVTGGCGFIGSHLVDTLLSLGKEVTSFDNLSTAVEANLKPNVRFLQGDIRNPQEVAAAVKGADLVFHLAANANGTRSVRDPIFDFETNALGTVNVLAAALDATVRRVVHISSAAVYGTPQTFPIAEDHPKEPFLPYGGSKLAAEVACQSAFRAYELPVTIGRPMAVFGPGETPELALVEVGRYLRWHLNGGPIRIIGNPDKKTRDFVHVSDVVQGLFCLADRGILGEAYNVASGGEVSMRQLAEIIGSATGRPAKIEAQPTVEQDTYRLVADVSKLRALGYAPQVTLEEGIRQLAQHLGERPTPPGGETIFTRRQKGESG